LHPTRTTITNGGIPMSNATATNGRPRKQLSEQLDRLDGIIDALADGLNQAVADAAREGTRLAVKDAIIEIMSNPELRAMLAPQSPPPAAPAPAAMPEARKPGLWSRIKAKVAAARAAVAGAVTRAKEAMIRRTVIAGDAVVALGRATGESLPVRRIALVGLGVGLLVGVACLVLPQTTAAVVSGVGATCTAVSAQVGNWLTRAARRVGLLS
jgi:hypothetical protein